MVSVSGRGEGGDAGVDSLARHVGARPVLRAGRTAQGHADPTPEAPGDLQNQTISSIAKMN